MRIGIHSNYPHIFALGLAHTFHLAGSVNLVSNGLYNNLLFDGDDKEQERDGILFNTEDICDYEILVNPTEPCDYEIHFIRPYYRELRAVNNTNKDILLVAERPSADLKFGKRLIMSEYAVSSENYIEFSLEEKDILADYQLGIKPTFSLDKLSRTYHRVLLDVYNRINHTSHTKIKQIAKKKASKKNSSTETSFGLKTKEE